MPNEHAGKTKIISRESPPIFGRVVRLFFTDGQQSQVFLPPFYKRFFAGVNAEAVYERGEFVDRISEQNASENARRCRPARLHGTAPHPLPNGRSLRPHDRSGLRALPVPSLSCHEPTARKVTLHSAPKYRLNSAQREVLPSLRQE